MFRRYQMRILDIRCNQTRAGTWLRLAPASGPDVFKVSDMAVDFRLRYSGMQRQLAHQIAKEFSAACCTSLAS